MLEFLDPSSHKEARDLGGAMKGGKTYLPGLTKTSLGSTQTSWFTDSHSYQGSSLSNRSGED